MKRLCKKGEIPTHKEASKIQRQLSTNPEVCEKCKIKPCVYGLYIWGDKRNTPAEVLK